MADYSFPQQLSTGLIQLIVDGLHQIFGKDQIGAPKLLGAAADGSGATSVTMTLYAHLNRTLLIDLAYFVETMPERVDLDIKRVTNFITITFHIPDNGRS